MAVRISPGMEVVLKNESPETKKQRLPPGQNKPRRLVSKTAEVKDSNVTVPDEVAIYALGHCQ